MNSRLLVIGCSYIENVYVTGSLPTDGGISEGELPKMRPGGRAGTAAVMASRLTGDEVLLCSAIGNDSNGKGLISFYKENNINTSYVSFPEGMQTGICNVIVEKSHSTVKKILYKGASSSFGASKVASALMSYPDAIYLTAEVPELLAAQVIASANAQDIPVYLDMSGYTPGSSIGTVGDIELFICSEAEATQLSGVRPTTVESALRCCISLRNKVDARFFILRLGRRGCFVYNGKYHYMFIPCSLEGGNVCGYVDFEAAAIAAEYLSTGSIKDACEIALVATKMAREFEQMSIPTREQIAIYASRKGIKINI